MIPRSMFWARRVTMVYRLAAGLDIPLRLLIARGGQKPLPAEAWADHESVTIHNWAGYRTWDYTYVNQRVVGEDRT